MLVAGAAVRLLHWATGRISEPDISEPERSLYELELGDWRDPEGYAVRHAARRNEAYDQRVDEWRQRFLREAAIDLRDLGRTETDIEWGLEQLLTPDETQ